MYVLLLASCEHQYLAIPRAVTVSDYDMTTVEGTAAPTWTADSTDLPDEAGESVKITIELNPTWTFETKEIVVIAWEVGLTYYGEYWVYELSSEELAAGAAEIEVSLTSEPPTEEYCAISYTGVGTCYGPVDEGLTTTTWVGSSGDGDSSTPVEIPISMDPLVTESTSDSCKTYEDCCGCIPDPDLGTNICPLQCSVYSSCSCPSGSSNVGQSAEGYTVCECPA